ncbi:MAG: nucleotidyltransferase domain-containing protein [archaeon]
MMNKQHEIIAELVKTPWKGATFKQIKALSKKKSESYIYNTLKAFVKQNILKEEKIGNNILYRLNLNSLKTLAYAGFIAEYTAWNSSLPLKDLNRIAKKIPADFFIMLVTGSYAKKQQKKGSDLDLIIISNKKPEKIQAELTHECELNIPKIHLYVFKKTEFLAMLLDKKANYGKEAAKNNNILFGAQNYFRIIGEAINHGFTG